MKRLLSIVACAVFWLPATGQAQGSQPVTIRGEIVALNCFMNRGQPPDTAGSDAACTREALAAGAPAVIVDSTTGDAYIAVSPDSATNEAKQLVSEASKYVELTGEVNERAGVKTITVREVKETDAGSRQQGDTGSSPSSSGS
jgi:hypothetical protein